VRACVRACVCVIIRFIRRIHEDDSCTVLCLSAGDVMSDKCLLMLFITTLLFPYAVISVAFYNQQKEACI